VTQTPESIARDFDRIAGLPHDPCDHNRLYHGRLLRELPEQVEESLEIGCGTGELTLKLARRSQRVLALDLSPGMLAAAGARCAGLPHVELRLADALQFPLEPDSFDVVATVATLHHLPLAETFERVRRALRPGGTFLALDVTDGRGALGVLQTAVGLPVTALTRLLTSGRLGPPPEVRAAWQAHIASDRFPPLSEVRRTAAAILPGARLRAHVYWRYSLVWRKPAQSAMPAARRAFVFARSRS
jgi:SAM-dependent methyltransferase